MRFFSVITLLIAATVITIDAAPLGGVTTVGLKKAKPLPSHFTPHEKFTIHMNRALIKYQKNIKDAHSKGLIGDEAIERLNSAQLDVTRESTIGSSGGSPGVVNQPLTDEGNDVGYHTAITIGGQSFTVICDTGSADLWVPSQNCTDSPCVSHNAFNPQESKNFRTSDKPFSITYGTGQVSGVIANDDISIGGIGVTNQIFGLTTSESSDFTNQEADGIMGMAFNQLSTQKAVTPFANMVKQKSVLKPQFSFLLGRKKDGTDSQLTLGGVDSSKFTGSITSNNLVSNQGFWEIGLDDASVNGKSLGLQGRTAIIDTGTTLVIAPEADAKALHKLIPGAQEVNQGEFVVPCDTTASVALTFGGVSHNINVKDLAFAPVQQNNKCISGIAGGNVGGPDQWLVGDTFLKNVYSVFDFGQNSVGFANLK